MTSLPGCQRSRERITRCWLRDFEGGYWHLRELNQRLTAARLDVGRLVERQRGFHLRLRRAADARLETLAMSLQRGEANLAHLTLNRCCSGGIVSLIPPMAMF